MVDLPPLDLTPTVVRMYMSPFHDTAAEYLKLLRDARESIHINIYGFHPPAVTEILKEKRRQGLAVDCLFDHGQAEGTAEAPELLSLMQARVPFLIGTSWHRAQLLHLKATVIDERIVQCGSWNYSTSATDQLNDFIVIEDARVAAWYLLVHDIVRAYLLRHERIFQPAGAAMPPSATGHAADGADLDPAPASGQVHRADVARPWLDNPPLPRARSKTA